MERMIGIDARTIFTSEITGIGTYVLKLVRYLLDRGERLTLFTNSTAVPPHGIDLSGVSVACAPGRTYTWEFFRLPRLLRDHPVDLYHATQNIGVPSTAVPTMLTLYDVIPLALKGYYSLTVNSIIEHQRYRLFIGQSVRRAGNIVTISEASKRDIISFFPAARNKISAIPLAADDAPDITKLPRIPELQNGPYLLYFGGFERRKNVELVLAAFPDIRKRFPDMRLVLVGKKNEYYRDHLTSYEDIPGIHFTDYLDRPSLDSLTAHATAVIYPSRYEGFGLPILEAMRFGTPVITSNVSSLPEVAHDAALLIDPDSREQLISAITKLLSDKPLRDKYGALGKQRASEYTWKKTFDATWEIYQQLLTQHENEER